MDKKNRLRRAGAILLIIFSLWIALIGAIVPPKGERLALNEELYLKRVDHQNREAEERYREKLEAEERERLALEHEQREAARTRLEELHWAREVKASEEAWDRMVERNERLAAVSSMISGGTAGEYQVYAYSFFEDYGWTVNDFQCLIYLWDRESHWNPYAHNGSSGAHGIPQSLPAGKMASEGADYYTNGYTQIRWGLKYIASRYGTPSAAWAHSQYYGWY